MNLDDNDRLVYDHHSTSIEKNFRERFRDILSIRIPDWDINLFVESDESNPTLRGALVATHYDKALEVQFRRGNGQFWLQDTTNENYPSL